MKKEQLLEVHFHMDRFSLDQKKKKKKFFSGKKIVEYSMDYYLFVENPFDVKRERNLIQLENDIQYSHRFQISDINVIANCKDLVVNRTTLVKEN